jgi:neurofibromin 1
MEGAPERVYDLLSAVKEVEKAPLIWPVLTALLCVNPFERTSADFSKSRAKVNSKAYVIFSLLIPRKQDRNFVELLIRYIGTASKFAEVAVVCLLDFARGISRTESIEELPWHPSEIAHEIKVFFWIWSHASLNELLQMYLMNYRNKKPFWDADEIDVAVISSALVAIYRFLPEEEALEMFKSCMEPEQSSAVRLCVIQACIMLTAEVRYVVLCV